jgi:hypothetical protein
LENERKRKNKTIKKIINQTAIQKVRETEGKYPYIVIRIYAAVYRQLPVVFVTDAQEKPTAGVITILDSQPFDVGGKLTDKARKSVVIFAIHIAETKGHNACAVFSESDCVYCEKYGIEVRSNQPPTIGLNADILPQDQ